MTRSTGGTSVRATTEARRGARRRYWCIFSLAALSLSSCGEATVAPLRATPAPPYLVVTADSIAKVGATGSSHMAICDWSLTFVVEGGPPGSWVSIVDPAIIYRSKDGVVGASPYALTSVTDGILGTARLAASDSRVGKLRDIVSFSALPIAYDVVIFWEPGGGSELQQARRSSSVHLVCG